MLRRDVALVWTVLGAVLVAVVVTYARLPAAELYHVSGSGLGSGLGRGLVELNFPDAIVALGVLAVVWPSLPGWGRRVGAVAALLCLVVVAPGVVDQGDLDAKPINALPALGVLGVVAVSFAARAPAVRRGLGDRLRIALAVLAVAASLPWIAAALGFYLDGVPLAGHLFQTGEIVSFEGNAPHPAVHHGMHHGFYGMLLVLAALLLSRDLAHASRVARPLLALMLAYGFGNIVNDGWLEQVAERGWADGTFPSVLEPALNWGWFVVLVAAAAVWALWFRSHARAEGVDAAAVSPPV